MAIVSEMQFGGYYHTEIYKCIAKGYQESKPEINLLKKDLFGHAANVKTADNKPCTKYYACLYPFNNDIFNCISDSRDKRVTDYINKLQKASELFENEWESGSDKHIVLAAQDMVDSFQKLSSEVVFSPDSKILSNVYLRYDCGFLDNLLCPSEVALYTQDNNTKKQKYMIYDARDPFVSACLLNIMHQYSKLKELHSKQTDHLLELRRSIFIRNAEKSHKRFLSVNRTTLSTRLNRTLNSITATPYIDVSSLESVKPIRLFEKIIQYISNYCENTNDSFISINVCIIGYTEPHYNSHDDKYEERELCDLGRAILRWLELEFLMGKRFCFNNININITNLYNKYDTPRAIFENINKEVFSYDFLNNNIKVSVEAKAFDYNYFNYGTSYFTDVLMNQYDVLFVIDCPFLSEENFELKRDYSLKDYCNTIQKWNYFDIDNYPRLDKKEASPLMILNAQFNRIMSSNTKDAGQICRVFHDYWITDIQKSLKHCDNNKEKVVYIFSSESDGVNHSSISNNPTSRTEQYEGKTFNIFRYSNVLSATLPCYPQNGKMELKISLWRMLKYASTEYAFNKFRQNTCLYLFGREDADFKNPIDLHVLYRNISVVIKEQQEYKGNERFILNIGIEYNKKILTSILNENSDKCTQNSLESLLDYIKSFVYAMYTQVYFPMQQKESQFGDQLLQNAFLMNLYSSASNVWDMWFLHQYRQAITSQNFEKFEINCVEEIKPFAVKSKGTKEEMGEVKYSTRTASNFFMDKKLYDLLFVALENSSILSPGLKNLLQISNQYYLTNDDDVSKCMLKNILAMYDQMIGKRDQFRDNCLECINDF